MGKNNNFDNQIQGQMTIDDLFSPPERMVAVSNIFARARKEMSLAEQKTFVYALSQIDWTKSAEKQSNVVKLNKKVLANILGYKSDPTDLSQNMWREIKDIWKHSCIEIADRDRNIYDSGTIISRITQFTNIVRIKFEEEYFPLFTGLGSDYITMWSMDIFNMTSERRVQFYELLRQMSYDKYRVEGTNTYSYGWGIKALKEMFDIPEEGKGSYMRSKENGGFNRSEFEKKVIAPLCADLAKCKMIQLVIQPNGKMYEKVKRGRTVDGYQFYWTYSAYPAVAAASEVRELQDKVDRNPQVLKVAKDILSGEKKSKKKKNSFNDFKQNDYDLDALEKMLLQN